MIRYRLVIGQQEKNKTMSLDNTFSEIPKKVKQSAYMVYASLGVGLIKSGLYETLTTQKILSDSTSLTVGIVTILLIGLLGYMIGQGKNWARITLLILFVIGMIGYPFIVLTEFRANSIIGIVSVIQMLIQLYVLIILFSGKTNDWFKHQNKLVTEIEK